LQGNVSLRMVSAKLQSFIFIALNIKYSMVLLLVV
jgi:hypothetical protein